MCKKSIKNSQPFVKKNEKVRTPQGGIFFDSHCRSVGPILISSLSKMYSEAFLPFHYINHAINHICNRADQL